MIRAILSVFDSFVFSVLDFLLFLAICLFVIVLFFIFWPFLKYPILVGVAFFTTYLFYQLYKIKLEQKTIQKDKENKLSEWTKQELQRPVIQKILQKQEENKAFLTGTITHVDNDGIKNKSLNISIKFKDN